MGGGASRWRPAMKNIGLPCVCFSKETLYSPQARTISPYGTSRDDEREEKGLVPKEAATAKSLCAICLEPLSSDDGGCCQALFTAQCTHVFHFPCIASNVRHGSVTCPICRAHWSQLPRDSTSLAAAAAGSDDPVLRILDDSIASSRVNRLSFLRSTRYDDDDPVELDAAVDGGLDRPRLHLAVVPAPMACPPPCAHLVPSLHHHHHHHCQLTTSPSAVFPRPNASPLLGQRRAAYVSVKLSQPQPTDLVLVASPNGPHLRLLKQSMALVVFWLRPVDRLAIVTYSTTATRAFPLRRMTAQGKRSALLVIDRLFYMGEAEPTEGLRKGVKILEDRRYHNPLSCILHLSDHPTRSYVCRDLQFPIPVHRFHIGFGFGMTSGLVMHEFEEFLARLLGGVIREAQLRVGEAGGLVRLGELRGGEERRIPLDLIGDCGFMTIGYSYVEGGAEQRLRTGEMVVETGEKGGRSDGEGSEVSVRGRSGSAERWDYLDPLMARRWAKHLHGHKP
ncbi:hypothetical protein Cni_G01650 [Canna indica]|uniref:RING-type domain-containing protein n=1 Tax=Canna indica TaxID=4628 RepID=A0AAQ3JN18_9LILI|nr:hypothetical protein Cni_G01650 [Canna indica]